MDVEIPIAFPQSCQHLLALIVPERALDGVVQPLYHGKSYFYAGI